ncbi:PaaI family thioesterase [Halorarius halobius]|uniref:PaaI family thioesterase n=1 Tax=Halorarius halobius TaxID=2962671 RepID=UPI0020CEEF6E|nr:PaaI family thioesterase [Halorarius halobius]
MGVEWLFEHMPFAEHLGIEVTAAEDGHAEGRLPLRTEHSSNPERMVAHGGVAYALADTVGGAAVISEVQDVTPTIDMRIDYLAPATGDELHASADVTRLGNSVAAVDVAVTDGDGTDVATARGVYKTGGGEGETAWVGEESDADALE